MKSLLSAALVAASLSLASPALADEYIIDTKGNHASVNFRISHLGFSWLTGRFNTLSGTFSYDEKNEAASKVNVEIDTASVDTNHADRDKHIRKPDFLDVEQFPKATFESTSVKLAGPGKATITGNLTLRGVTKEITIDATHVGGGADPWGGVRQGFTGTTTLTLADFGIDQAGHLGPAKTIELTLNLEGVRK